MRKAHRHSRRRGRTRFSLPCTGGLVDRGISLAFSFDGRNYSVTPEIRWPRRSSPTACAWSAARSSTTVRAAFHRRTEEPNALVELRARSRREPNTRATTHRIIRWPCRDEPKSLAFACLRCDGGQRLAVAVLSGGFLLQDLHVAAGLLGEGL